MRDDQEKGHFSRSKLSTLGMAGLEKRKNVFNLNFCSKVGFSKNSVERLKLDFQYLELGTSEHEREGRK